ncbi:MAG: hypothetical protein IJX75_02685 [Clostridia bacterium]|nr:hypothetical protein [Clostridia bacterium]
MLCCNCKENQATKTYEQVKNGKLETQPYCFDCYQRLFINASDSSDGVALLICPYCGITADDVRTKKLVGCAYCYRTLKETLLSEILKMQGEQAHCGKRPPVEGQDVLHEPTEEEQRDAKRIAEAKYKRQYRELTLIIEKLKEEKKFDAAKGYADKLSRMKSKKEIEEDFVWRGKTKISE